MKTHLNTIARIGLGISVATLLGACGGSSGGTGNSTSGGNSGLPDNNNIGPVPTVANALEGFPMALLPRFALSNSDVTAADIYRRIDFSPSGIQTLTYGVEGESDNELLEREARYAASGANVESIMDEQIVLLPANIDTAVQSQYSESEIIEISRVTANDSVSYEVTLENESGQMEVHFDENAQLLFVVKESEADSIPAGVLAAIDAQSITLPDLEFEIATFADGSLNIEAHFENDEGQSITIRANGSGDILRTEHGGVLENLSSSDTVEMALNNFPENIETQFSTMFSEVTAVERFRSLNFNGADQNIINYGIEGESEDEELVIEALFSAEGILLEQTIEEVLDTLPTAIEADFNIRFPGAAIDEIVQVTDEDGSSYDVAFEQDDSNFEANFDADGNFIESVKGELEESEIPVVILTAIGAERVLLPTIEFERITEADGSITFIVDYENGDGHSISYELAADGTIEQIDHVEEL